MAITISKGIKIVNLLCLLLCVAEANILDDIFKALGSNDHGSSHPVGISHSFPKLAPSPDTLSPTAPAPKSGPGVFDVTEYGAKADGKTVNSKEFLEAWKEACSFAGNSFFVIPEGEFLLGDVDLEGPCKGPLTIEIRGTLLAVEDANQFNEKSWITIRGVKGLNMGGGGTVDGQGKRTWDIKGQKQSQEMMPSTLKIVGVEDAKVNGINFVNSKSFHLHVTRCNNVEIYNVKISAPEESPNTDGIHISSSTGIKIIDTLIGVGDDCISIGHTNQDILISNVFCGPGHGISIGSLGKYKDEKPVTGVHVKNCTLSGTTNGIRIKTWPGAPDNQVSNFTFEDIVVDRVAFPIIIDQSYCPSDSCHNLPPSKVAISDIVYKNIRGTSFTKLAVNILCSSSFPCKNVQMSDINIAYQDSEGKTASFCSNAKLETTGLMIPPPCT